MADLQNEMSKLKSNAADQAIVRDAYQTLNKQQTDATSRQVTKLLQRICMDIAQNPDISVTSTEAPGFSVSLINAIDPAQLPFTVTATFSGNHVELSATDGQWNAASNVHGNWAGWTDEQILFRGPFDETRVRKAVSNAFLHWYQHAISR